MQLVGWMGPEPSSAFQRLTQCRGERWLPFLKGPPFPSFSSSSALHSIPDLGQGAWLQPLMHQDRADHLLSDHWYVTLWALPAYSAAPHFSVPESTVAGRDLQSDTASVHVAFRVLIIVLFLTKDHSPNSSPRPHLNLTSSVIKTALILMAYQYSLTALEGPHCTLSVRYLFPMGFFSAFRMYGLSP